MVPLYVCYAVGSYLMLLIFLVCSINRLTNEERSLVWEKRYYLQSIPKALPCLLQAVPSWAPSNLSRIYAMIKEWAALDPLDGLQLLLPRSVIETIPRALLDKWYGNVM